ncbi:MAG TPA: DUF5677 domain-containing protein [Candidatus Saccharimonadales bacterium]|jgi:hypothetical protein|nr:DUF5677 domain-containing protein [Candidatus Saccharimonadales bacterium]
MLEIRADIDDIVAEVSELMKRVYDGLQQQNIEPKADPSKGAALIVFRLGFEYFIVSRDALHKGLLIGGGAAVRTGLENVIDLLYIYDKPEKYAKAYVESMTKFNEVMRSAAAKGIDAIAQSRELKQANKWTNASIEDRLKASGNAFITVYDMLSYFGHPNPGSLNYITNKRLKDGQLNLLKQASCISALTMMAVTLKHTDITNITIQELDVVARKLGTQLVPDGSEGA